MLEQEPLYLKSSLKTLEIGPVFAQLSYLAITFAVLYAC